MRTTLVILLLCFTRCVSAQQEVLYTQYMFNGLALNPGYAGNKDVLSINFTYRNQWGQLEGAPRTMLLSVEKGLPEKNLGLGFHVFRDQLGAQKQISPFLSAAYRITVSPGTILSTGIAIGLSQYQLDGTMLDPAGGSDQAISSKLNSTIAMDAKFGLYLNNDRFYIGLSAANLFNNNVNYTGDQKNIIVPQRLHYFLTGGYVFPLGEAARIYPSVLIRENFNQPTNADLNLFLVLRDKIGVGGSYRSSIPLFSKENLQKDLNTRAAASALVQLYPTKAWRIGYSYDFNIGGLNSYFGGSHELSLGFQLIPPEKSVRMFSPRYY